MPIIMNSHEIREKVINNLTDRCNKLRDNNITPSLKVILVGNNQASIRYTNSKQKFCLEIGAKCEIIKLDESISEEKFSDTINTVVNDQLVHGCLIQLPLPSHLQKIDLPSIIPPSKDVDGFHYENIGKLFYNQDSLLPCTPKGIITCLKHYKVPIAGKHIVIIGRSHIVGRPLALMLINQDATVTICHSKTENLNMITKTADIIISAIGRANFINKTYLNLDKKQILVDVGINQNTQGKLCGDIDFENVLPYVSAITPVPGGIGPMTIISLMQNLLQAAEKTYK